MQVLRGDRKEGWRRRFWCIVAVPDLAAIAFWSYGRQLPISP